MMDTQYTVLDYGEEVKVLEIFARILFSRIALNITYLRP